MNTTTIAKYVNNTAPVGGAVKVQTAEPMLFKASGTPSP
jgi:hypothetical protein